MIAAIYCRKSSAKARGVDEDAKSTKRQENNGRAFAAELGHTVPDAYVFKDEAISGAEKWRLRDKQRLLEFVRSGGKPPFQVLIMQKSDRLSRRDGAEAVVELTEIAKAGIQIWFYWKRERFTYGDFKSNISNYTEAEFNAEFRRVVAEKTTEAFLDKARLGHVLGGRRFGYTNIKVDGRGDLKINDDERPVIERIFDLRAAGSGYTRIAKALNREKALCPQPQQDRPAGWSPSTVRAVLHNELYRGMLVQFKTKKRNEDGEIDPRRRDESEWVRTERPDLRIVSDEQWNAAHARMQRARTTMTTAIGRRAVVRRDYESKYLLTGFVRCTTCRGSITVVSRSHGRKRAYF